jgi:hypothetical protein
MFDGVGSPMRHAWHERPDDQPSAVTFPKIRRESPERRRISKCFSLRLEQVLGITNRGQVTSLKNILIRPFQPRTDIESLSVDNLLALRQAEDALADDVVLDFARAAGDGIGARRQHLVQPLAAL